MKAKQHLLISFFIIFSVTILIIFYDKNSFFSSMFSSLFPGEEMLVLLIGICLFSLGAIFPDIDSEDDGSYIFHQPILKPLAKFVKKILEIFGKLNHKGFTHTVLGISLDSILVVLIISIISYSLILNKFSFLAMLFWYFMFFFGQLSHLIEDKMKDPKWLLKLK